MNDQIIQIMGELWLKKQGNRKMPGDVSLRKCEPAKSLWRWVMSQNASWVFSEKRMIKGLVNSLM